MSFPRKRLPKQLKKKNLRRQRQERFLKGPERWCALQLKGNTEPVLPYRSPFTRGFTRQPGEEPSTCCCSGLARAHRSRDRGKEKWRHSPHTKNRETMVFTNLFQRQTCPWKTASETRTIFRCLVWECGLESCQTQPHPAIALEHLALHPAQVTLLSVWRGGKLATAGKICTHLRNGLGSDVG